MLFKNKNNILKFATITFLVIILIHSILGTLSFKDFLNLKALEIIIAGILISVIISYSFDTLVFSVNVIRDSFSTEIDYETDIYTLYEFAKDMKRQGPLKLQSKISEVDNDFMRNSLNLICDCEGIETIREVLQKDIESRRIKLLRAYNVLRMVSQVAPAFGLIGTLLGMIGLLSNMDNPQLIVANMSSALVSTLYGALIANFIAIPLMGRVNELINKKTLQYNMIAEGIILIAKKDTVRNVFDKMNVMLPDNMRLEYPRKTTIGKGIEALNEYKI